tara:strand:+ start:982 stop:1188 length:207 start_codon:yes stop_codon:yes gene_type:complete
MSDKKEKVEEAQEVVEENVPQNYVISLELLNEVVNILGQLNYKSVFQLMEKIRSLPAVKLNEDTKETK